MKINNRVSRYFEAHERKCPQCGKIHYPIDLENYAYKRIRCLKGTERLLYFCSWSCLRAYEKEQEEKKKAKKNQPVKPKVIPSGKHCIDCRYCSFQKQENLYHCSTYTRKVNPNKKICRRYKPPKEEDK